ncbi:MULTISPECIES: hypothetical protein [unclassified Pseudomonas]|jgi:hypothetical protein|uniref:hypothetical protein n=1 Tax=unclassified Pseudomonas TaxID=196821 RepID=UPI0018D63A61|nr:MULTISPECIES: hypothetical protein [unclassified Pseudomonas]MBH3362871.1 hypothetical protein [Pseudomonas sp. URMO17WK12:I11]
MTNEQSVIDLEKVAKGLKDAYYAYLKPLSVDYAENGRLFTLSELLECQRLGNAYFNAVESFVADSDLLGAHDRGRWVTNFAETCHSTLNTYIIHIQTLRVHAAYLPNVAVEPDPHALASTQRMVKEYCTRDISKGQFKAFKKAKLPTKGFTVAAHQDRQKLPTWQIALCMTAGILLLLGSAAIALFLPNPTPFQGFIFRGIFAIALACLIVGVPGFMKMNLRLSTLGQLFSLVAGGSVVIFFVVWFFNPPEGFTSQGIQSSVEASHEPESEQPKKK